MSRATPEEVRAITGSTATDEVIQPFLDTAHILVNSVQLCANTDEETLTQAEAYLAAHLMSISAVGQNAGGTTAKDAEKFDLYSITWAVSKATGQGALSTGYGQTANMLLNGCLEQKNQKPSGIIFSGGA